MRVRLAGPDDLEALVSLRRAWGVEDGYGDPAFAETFREWARGSGATHTAFVAVDGDEVVGMAWLARLERPPSPRHGPRLHGDVQSVYVLPEHRDAGIGAALVRAVTDHARDLGMLRLTVQSGRRAVPLYERAGFAASPKLLALDLV